MDYTEYTVAKNKLSSHPNLCDLFKLISIETWKRLEYAYLKPGIRIYETTLTQNLIFTINAYNDQYNFDIDLLEARDEATNGNDIELIIRFPKDGVEFYAPIQAKKVYKNSRYYSMDHGDQIVSLRTYASSKGAIPFYLLYNFTSSPIKTGVTLTSPMELTGCTLITAEYLFYNYYNARTKHKDDGTTELAWMIPKFYDLNPTNSFPWHELVCPGSSKGLLSKLQEKGTSKDILEKEITDRSKPNNFYPLDTFKDKTGWISIKDLNVVSDEMEKEIYTSVRISEEPLDISKTTKEAKTFHGEKYYPVFSPKSRVVITHKQ